MKSNGLVIVVIAYVFFSSLQNEEKILLLPAELSNMAASISRYSALDCSDLCE